MSPIKLPAISPFVGSKKLGIAALAEILGLPGRTEKFACGRLEILFLFVIAIIGTQNCPSAAAQNVLAESPTHESQSKVEESKDSSEKDVVPVVFPAVMPPVQAPAQLVPAPTRIAMPGVAAPTIPMPQVPRTGAPNGRVNVSIMKGEVHMRNLNPKMGSGEILSLTTGDRSSCEFKLNGAIGRVWQNSDATVFAGSNVVMLSKGDLHLSVRRASGGEFTVISGDLLCRVKGTTVHVSRHDGHVKFSVMEGTVTVYNRQTGEILKVSP